MSWVAGFGYLFRATWRRAVGRPFGTVVATVRQHGAQLELPNKTVIGQRPGVYSVPQSPVMSSELPGTQYAESPVA